jgi:hypothetical protein
MAWSPLCMSVGRIKMFSTLTEKASASISELN